MTKEHVQQQKSDAGDTNTISLPKGIEINFYDEYMQITRKWFSLHKSIGLAIAAVIVNGLCVDSGFPEILLGDRELPLKAFALLFIVFGAASVYLLLVILINKSQIYVSKQAIEIRHRPLPWLGNKRVETTHIKQFFVERKVGPQRNGSRSVSYRVLAVTDSDKQFKLISGLEARSQALYIEQEIESYLGIKNEKVFGEVEPGI